jgi:ABC-2 type transport system permease protein
VVREVRVKEAGYDGDTITKLIHPIDLETVRITKEGDKAETGMAGFFFAYGLFFLLYIMIMLYGQQVMSGVLEEKTSRIVEVIISTVKPFELMLGKLVGICMVGLTQILIWLITAAVLTAPGAAFALAAMPTGIPTVSPTLILHFAGHFLLGFFLYASFYAALGAAFNDIREAQQAASSATFFLIMPVFLMFMIINDPDSPLAVATSLFPPFTPLLMLLRIAVKTPPAWQIILGYALTTGFVIFMTWTCSKIYRVGILMYGKKPTLKELLRWMKYA